MQADLMHAFFCFANVMYDPSILETTSTSATKFKLYISFLLRTFDGLFSLTVNFYLMLVTAETLSVFTNFAALYFLQDIDDVFYGLVQLVRKSIRCFSMLHCILSACNVPLRSR